MGSGQDSNLHQERLRLVLKELQHALLSSREQLERHLRLFPDDILRAALERAEERQERQFPLPFTDAFEAAEQSGEYVVTRPVTVEDVFCFLRQELGKRFFRGEALTSPDLTKRYLIAELAAEEREVFAAIFLDTKHRPLALEKLFYGTIDACSVHAREVAKRALALNAAAVILAHNHPSGTLEPSNADRTITVRLREGLALFDIRLLDHIIVGGEKAVSMAEYGYI